MQLKELLKSRGLKQKWLAKELGVSEVTISNWCSLKSIPSDKNLKKMSKILNISSESIMKQK